MERNGKRFREDKFDVTGEELGLALNARGTDEQQLSLLNRLYDAWVASGNAQQALVLPSDFGEDVEMFVDTTRRPTFDKQEVGVRDGKFTINTILDRVVFGEPIFADDLWQKHRLHESSRRRNGECGLDVIVASAMQRHGHGRRQMLTAQKAAGAGEFGAQTGPRRCAGHAQPLLRSRAHGRDRRHRRRPAPARCKR